MEQYQIILSVVGFLVLGIRITHEMIEKNKWEKNRFLVSQIEKFNSKQTTKIVHKVLETNGVEIQLDGDSIDIDEDDLFECFMTEESRSYFLPQHVHLREIFNEYFDDLTKLVILYKADLVDKYVFKSLLGHWLDKLSGTPNGTENRSIRRQMHEYLIYYGYNELMSFIIKYRGDNYRQITIK